MKTASTAAGVLRMMHGLEAAWRVLRSILSKVHALMESVARFASRLTGAFLALGGLCAILGWVLVRVNPQPLAPTWLPALWLVTLGIVLLLLGMLALYVKNVLRAGVVGSYGLLFFLLGAVVLIGGAWAIDGFILPSMYKLIDQIPNLGAPLQSALNTTTSGVNTTTSTVTQTGSTVCNTITSPFGQVIHTNCSTSAPGVPQTNVPTLDGPTLINGLFAKLGLPPLSVLATLGLIFLSGAPLALGCLVLALAFLLAGQKPRSALLLVIICSIVNLGGQFLVNLAFLGSWSGIVLYLSLLWLGLTLWFPAQTQHVVTKLFGKLWHSTEARLASLAASDSQPALEGSVAIAPGSVPETSVES